MVVPQYAPHPDISTVFYATGWR